MSVFLQNKCLFVAHVTCPTGVDGEGSDSYWQGSPLMEALPLCDTLSQPKDSNSVNT